MKKTKLLRLLSLVAVLTMLICMGAVQASAANSNAKVPVCGSLDSDGNVVDLAGGIPIYSEGTAMFFSSKSFYLSDEYLYIAVWADRTVVQLEYENTDDMYGVTVWTSDELSADMCFTCNTAYIGQKAMVVCTDDDYENVKIACTVTGYNSDTGRMSLDIADIPDGITVRSPAAVVNEDNELIALIIENGGDVAAYPALGVSDSTPTPTDPTPTEPQTSGAEDPDQPTRPSSQSPATPAPVAPTSEAPEEPSKDAPARGEEETKEEDENDSEDDEDDEEFDPLPFIIAGGVLIIAIVAAIIVLSSKKKKAPVVAAPIEIDSFPETIPTPDYIPEPEPISETKPVEEPVLLDEPPVIIDEPVSVPEPEIKVYLVGVNGAHAGLEYPIGDNEIIIGRAHDVTVKFPEDTKGVSRRHCRIGMLNGVLNVIDLGSTAGTYISGKGQLAPNTPTVIKVDDVISLGSDKVSFKIVVK